MIYNYSSISGLDGYAEQIFHHFHTGDIFCDFMFPFLKDKWNQLFQDCRLVQRSDSYFM